MEKSALELLEEIGNCATSPEKAAKVQILIPKLKEKITNEIGERVELSQENLYLHLRLGDKPISDCHNIPCEEHPGLDYFYCPKCLETDEEGKRTGEPAIAKYHWEEHKHGESTGIDCGQIDGKNWHKTLDIYDAEEKKVIKYRPWVCTTCGRIILEREDIYGMYDIVPVSDGVYQDFQLKKFDYK